MLCRQKSDPFYNSVQKSYTQISDEHLFWLRSLTFRCLFQFQHNIHVRKNFIPSFRSFGRSLVSFGDFIYRARLCRMTRLECILVVLPYEGKRDTFVTTPGETQRATETAHASYNTTKFDNLSSELLRGGCLQPMA